MAARLIFLFYEMETMSSKICAMVRNTFQTLFPSSYEEEIPSSYEEELQKSQKKINNSLFLVHCHNFVIIYFMIGISNVKIFNDIR